MDVKNPLHGKYAEPIGTSSSRNAENSPKTCETPIPLIEDGKSSNKKIKIIGFFLLVLIAMYPIVIGIVDLFTVNNPSHKFGSNRGAASFKHRETSEPSLFERFFCQGARRSRWCGDNRD